MYERAAACGALGGAALSVLYRLHLARLDARVSRGWALRRFPRVRNPRRGRPALEPQLLAAVQTRSGSADAGLYLSAFGYAPGDFSAPLPAAHYPLLALLALGAFAAPYCADRIFTARAKRRISALTRELEKINLGGGRAHSAARGRALPASGRDL